MHVFLSYTQESIEHIPVLCEGDWKEAAPSFLLGIVFADLREGDSYEENYHNLLNTLLNKRESAPLIGKAEK